MSTQPPSPQIKPVHGTLLALVEHGRIHLIRRNKEPYKGMLGLPGGKMEEGETPMDAARREMREETGLRRPTPRWLGRVTDLLIEGHPPYAMFILDVFEADLAEGTLPQPSFEGTIVHLPLDELEKRAGEIIPADLVILMRMVVERSTTRGAPNPSPRVWGPLDLVSIRRGDGYEARKL
jgi:ADP-ribose pyrophosphatase YjhB (NUDIX family)